MIFKNLTKKHKHGVGEDLGENVDFFLADSQYNIRNDRKEDHAKNDASCLNAMNYMAIYWETS